MDTKERIIDLLSSTRRKGIDKLIAWLIKAGFFEAPASTMFHGSYEGGLAKHSLAVHDEMIALGDLKLDKKSGYGQMAIKVKPENIVIATLLHDICKIGAYQRTKKSDGWANNRAKEKGHAKLSIKRIKKFIKLDKIEELMIRFHMGIYGLNEFHEDEDNPNGEYLLRGDHSMDEQLGKEESSKRRYGKSLANVYYHNPIVKVMSICDELATLKEKAKTTE